MWGLAYAFLFVRRLSGSSTFGLVFLLLLGTEYFFNLGFALTAIRNWHWAALFGSGYHLATALRSVDAWRRWHLLGYFLFAGIGFGIGYDFVAIQGLFCLGVMVLTTRARVRSWRSSIGPLVTVVAGFLVPFLLRQLQVIGYLGLDFWWHDLYYSAVIKTSFLNRWLPLPDLAAIDDWYLQHSVLRPPASSETAPLLIWETVNLTLRDVWLPRFGAERLGLSLVGLLLAIGTIVVACILARSASARSSRDGSLTVSTKPAHSPPSPLSRAAAVVIMLGVTQAVGIYFFSPLSIHIYLKHAMPAVVAPLLIGHAFVLFSLGHLVANGWRWIAEQPLAGRLTVLAAGILSAAIIGLHVERQVANAEEYPLYSKAALVGIGLRATPTIRSFPCPHRLTHQAAAADGECHASVEHLPAHETPKVAYVPTIAALSGAPAPPGTAPGVDASGGAVRASAVEAALVDGAYSYTGDSYELWRSRGDGQFQRIVGNEGQRLRVPGIGLWDPAAAEFKGLDVVASGSHWLPDLSGLEPINGSSRFAGLTGDSRAPVGWQVGPPDAEYTVARLLDEDGPFVRITVQRAGDAVLLYRGERPPGSGPIPLSARARVRAQQVRGVLSFSLSEQSPTGPAVDHVAQVPPHGTWQTLVLNVERTTFPGELKVIYLGILGVEPGDTFDVREIDLFVGIVP